MKFNAPSEELETMLNFGIGTDDICANRHGGDPQSVAANQRVAPSKASMRAKIRRFVGTAGSYGATLLEFCTAEGIERGQVSGRFTESRKAGEIFKNGQVREGCAVYVGRTVWEEKQ